MQLGQPPDLGFDPGAYEGDPGGGVYDDPSFVGQKVDPETESILAQELPGFGLQVDEVVGTPAIFDPVDEDTKIPMVAVGVGLTLLVGTLWYFNR